MVFLLRWLERGLGQILAPDKNYIPNPDAIDTSSDFWNYVAPDPNFMPTTTSHDQYDNVTTTTTTSTNTPSHEGDDDDDLDDEKKDSPIIRNDAIIKNSSLFMSPTPSSSVSTKHQQQQSQIVENRSILLSSPPPRYYSSRHTKSATKRGGSNDMSTPIAGTTSSADDIETQVLITAKSLASCMISPTIIRKKMDAAFRLCASTNPLNVTNQNKLRQLVMNDPTLFHTRCSKMGHTCPDGFTLLMATAYTNHVVAAQILCSVGNMLEQLKETNLQGKTAYHIAAENGHVEMVEFLKAKYHDMYGLASPPPVDLLGMTPLGVAVTSPIPNAQKHKKALYDTLFNPTDPSIAGTPLPKTQRVTYNHTLSIIYSVSQMPGKRVIMEDSAMASSLCHNAISLFAICDGHGDYGQVSKFVAETFPSKLQQSLQPYHHEKQDQNWEKICTDICIATDQRLQECQIPGGTTAVLAIVTMNEIICANIGDCRCLLIQQKNNSDDDDNHATFHDKYEVIPLSFDHKPNIPEEMQRIQNAGLEVIQETFIEHDQQVTIAKVQLSDTNRMAISRSFGDFEYKANKSLNEQEQAIIAIPDVLVRQRNYDNDLLLVLACDGIFDVMSNDDVGQFIIDRTIHNNNNVNQRDNKTPPITTLPMIGDDLLKECLQRGSTDNLSCIIVSFHHKINEAMGLVSSLSSSHDHRKVLDFTPVATK